MLILMYACNFASVEVLVKQCFKNLLTYLLTWFAIFQGGNYLLQLMDTYCTGWGLLIIALVECVAVSWVYGKSVLLYKP